MSLAITQDHPHAVFANLLKELLLTEDVAEVNVLDEGQQPGPADGPDVLISGSVVCNGYSEVYYQAELACLASGQPVCSVSEKPASGDRQSNLAIEVVGRLKSELDKLVSRNERRRALRELRGDIA